MATWVHSILVRDTEGRVYLVGSRDSQKQAQEAADIYNRDCIQQGYFWAESRMVKR